MPSHVNQASFAMMDPAFLRSIVETGERAEARAGRADGKRASPGRALLIWLTAVCRPKAGRAAR